jgi:hypothetical protein
MGLIGSGLSLAGIFITTGYGFDPNSKYTQIGPDLAYAGSAATGAGVLFAATGLGIEHSALRLAGVDPGYGLYATGTLFGILGLAGIGASYFLGLTNYVNDSAVIGFGCSIASAVVLTVGGLFYVADSNRMRRIYARLTTF